MSSSLDSVDISGLQLVEDWDSKIRSVSETASAGNLIVYEQDKNYRDLTLMGGDNWGILKQGILRKLRDLSSTKGATYVLNYEGTSYTVRFKTEEIPIESETVGNPVSTNDETYHNNIILRLMEV